MNVLESRMRPAGRVMSTTELEHYQTRNQDSPLKIHAITNIDDKVKKPSSINRGRQWELTDTP